MTNGSASLTLVMGSGGSALVQIAAFFTVWVGLWIPLAIPIAFTLGLWRNGESPRFPLKLTAEQKLPLLAPLYLIAPCVLWGASRVEKVPFSRYGLALNSQILSALGLGLGLAILGLIVLFSIERGLSWIQWNPWPKNFVQCVLFPTLLLALWISTTEELIFRGFLLNQLQTDFSMWEAAIISSGIFAGLHLVWEVQETLPQLPGLGLMGLILVLAWWVDEGNLGLAIGLHAGWIWGITCVDTAGLINYTQTAPEWITGLARKPLAGVMGIVLLLGTGAVIGLL